MPLKNTETDKNAGANQSLEDMLLRLREIEQIVRQRLVSLSDTVPLVEEAFKLKEAIEKELTEIENKLIQLTGKSGENLPTQEF